MFSCVSSRYHRQRLSFSTNCWHDHLQLSIDIPCPEQNRMGADRGNKWRLAASATKCEARLSSRRSRTNEHLQWEESADALVMNVVGGSSSYGGAPRGCHVTLARQALFLLDRERRKGEGLSEAAAATAATGCRCGRANVMMSCRTSCRNVLLICSALRRLDSLREV